MPRSKKSVKDSRSFEVVVRKIEKPFSSNPEKEFEFLCASLGFFEPVKGKTASNLFKEVLSASEKGLMLSSSELSRKIKISRTATLNQLNNLMRSGLVVRHGRFYISRSPSIFRTVEEVEEDIERIFQRMKNAAKDLDRKFGIEID